VIESPRESTIGLAFILAGVPVYFVFKHLNQKNTIQA
jgi:ABC-type thiamine transport system substrate-binding protein